MYSVTAIAFKKFVTWDEKYWTGFPTVENPEYMPTLLVPGRQVRLPEFGTD